MTHPAVDRSRPLHAALLLGLFVTLSLSACGGSAPLRDAPITVEGRAYVAGNEPFTAMLLRTDAGVSYVLDPSEITPPLQPRMLPARLRVVGTVYKDTWGSLERAHLRLISYEVLQR